MTKEIVPSGEKNASRSESHMVSGDSLVSDVLPSKSDKLDSGLRIHSEKKNLSMLVHTL